MAVKKIELVDDSNNTVHYAVGVSLNTPIEKMVTTCGLSGLQSTHDGAARPLCQLCKRWWEDRNGR